MEKEKIAKFHQFFNKIKEIPEVKERLNSLPIGISFSDTGHQLIIQNKGEENIDVQIISKRADEILQAPTSPTGELKANLVLSTEIFHQILAGTLNPMLALREKKVKAEGYSKVIMMFTHLLIQIVPFYKEFINSDGL